MAHKILIPTPLRVYAGKQDVVEAEGRTVGELLANMTAEHTDLRNHLYTEDGKLRSFDDIYGRAAPILAALDAPRQQHRARRTSEEAVEIIDDMKTT